MELRRGYRQTEVGVIPEHWEVKTIDQVGFVTSGKRLPIGSSLVERPTPHPYIRVTDMRPGTVSLSEIKFVPEIVFPAIKRYRIFSDDIFISVAGTLGIVGKVPKDLDGANLTENADRITNITCSQGYLIHVLMSPLIQNTIDSIQTVGAQPKLALTRLRKFAIPVPPLPEQCAIAGALSDADALLDALDRLIAKKRDLKQAAMRQLLTGQTRLPGFHDEWEMKTLDEVCQKIQDGTHFSPKLGGNDYFYVTSKNIRFGTLDMSTAERISATEHAKIYARCDVRLGDLLLTKDGANTGNAALNFLDEPFSLLSSVAILRFDHGRYSPAFFMYQILSIYGQEQITEMMSGNAITRLTLAKIRKLRFAVASFEEQTAIAAVLTDMDAELDALEQRLAKTRALKQGMMQELLTGKTRLVSHEATHA